MKYKNNVNKIGKNSLTIREDLYNAFLENYPIEFYRESWAELSHACFPFYITDVKEVFE